jgi:hypothetical protein
MQWKAEAGKRPTKALLAEASTLVRPNTKDHVVVAMALRPNGVTQNEVVLMFKRPHRNVIKRLVQDNKVKQYTIPEDGRTVRVRLVRR